jgi:hypothetical protein
VRSLPGAVSPGARCIQRLAFPVPIAGDVRATKTMLQKIMPQKIIMPGGVLRA